MSKTVKLVVIAIAVVVVAGGAILIQNKTKEKTPSASNNNSNSSQDTSANNDKTAAALTITYDGNNFSLSADTIKVGETVKVTNSSSSELDFDSDPHPVHTDNTELNVGAVAPGESKTFTVHKTGTWGFHNHLDASQHGSFTVVE
jgi:plastocyanin